MRMLGIGTTKITEKNMDQKPPRPQTLRIGSPNTKRTQRVTRHRRPPLKRNPLELQLLADDIKGIIEDISFESAAEEKLEDGLRRSYVGIHRRSTIDRTQRRPPRDVISAFYRERQTNRNELTAPKSSGFDSEQRSSDYNKRVSCPWDLPYFNQGHDGTPLEILAQELKYARDVREKEVRSLLHLNTKLQNDLLETDREMCVLEEKNAIFEKKYDDMLKVYERIRENLKRCLTKVKDLECIGRLSSANNSDDESIHRGETSFQGVADSLSSGINTWMSDTSSINTSVNGYDGDGEASICKNNDNESKPNEDQCDQTKDESHGTSPSSSTGDRQLLMRLQADVNSLSLVNTEQSQEIERLRSDLSSCRKHMSSTQFQLEAVEIECSRLLSMEDQLISVVNLLKWAKEKHVHRQIMGDHIYSAVEVSTRGEYSNAASVPADLFLRELQDQLSANPIIAVDGKFNEDERPSRPSRQTRTNEKRKGMHIDLKLIDQIKFADDEDDQVSDTDSFHSLGKYLNENDEGARE